MSRGLNKAMLIGNLGADPETRYSGSGLAITNISVATSAQWRDKATGEKQERTEWHRVKAFGKLAEIIGEYMRKGSTVYVEGELRTDVYTDRDNVERRATYIIADKVQGVGAFNRDRDSAPAGARGRREPDAPPPSNDADFSEDDIPF